MKYFKIGDVFDVQTEVEHDPEIYRHKTLIVTARRGQTVYFTDEHGHKFKESCILYTNLSTGEQGEMIACSHIGTFYAN